MLCKYRYICIAILWRPGPTAPADAKRIQCVKKILPSIEKRYASTVYLLRTYLLCSTHQACIHCDFIRLKIFELHKTFWTDKLSVGLQHKRAINGLFPVSFVKRLRYPFCILLASFQHTSAAPDNGEREGRKGTWNFYTMLVSRTQKDVNVCI